MVNISFEARKHHFKISDITNIYQTNLLLLFTLIVLSFLFSYKLVQYIAQFKLLELRSRIDIVFLTFLAVGLYLPMSNISDLDKSTQENRMLAKKPVFLNNSGINLEYGEQFETWFNDRFFGRNWLIWLYTDVKLRMNRYYENNKAMIVDNNWMFNKGDIQKSLYSENDLKLFKSNISFYLDYCKKNSIKCYMQIVPRRLEFIPDNITINREFSTKDSVKDVVDYVKQSLNYDISYPVNDLKKANLSDFVFFKTDHHWTEWGAYIGYQSLMKQIMHDFPEIQPISEDDYNIFYTNKVRAEVSRSFFWIGSSCKILALSEKQCKLDVNYKNYTHKEDKKLLVNWDKKTNNKDFSYPNARNPQKVVLIGNSFTENFSSFLAYTFKFVKKIRYNNNIDGGKFKFSRWYQDIKEFSPDIMILLIQSESFDHFRVFKD